MNIKNIWLWCRRRLKDYGYGLQVIPKYEWITGIISTAIAIKYSIIFGVGFEIISQIPAIIIGHTKQAHKTIEYDTHLRNQQNPELMKIHKKVNGVK